MRPVDEWDFVYLNNLVNTGAEESLTLEFKTSPSLLAAKRNSSELTKDVAAFANSAGGFLVFGIEEKNNVAVSLDSGLDANEIDVVWLENKLTSNIRPPIEGLIIKTIRCSAGRVYFVLEVPQATTFAPHQSEDKRYYKRRNFKSEPMEDYEIRALGRRSVSPHLTIDLSLEPLVPEEALIKVSVRNISPNPAMYSFFTIYIDKRAPTVSCVNFSQSEAFINISARPMPCALLRKTNTIPASFPIFKEARLMYLGEFTVRPQSDGAFFIYIEAGAPGFSVERLHWLNVIDGEMHLVTS